MQSQALPPPVMGMLVVYSASQGDLNGQITEVKAGRTENTFEVKSDVKKTVAPVER